MSSRRSRSTSTYNLLLLAALGLVAGCSESPAGGSAGRAQFRPGPLPDGEHRDAVEFFESGGHLWNVGAEGEPPVDEEHVLPLVKALSNEARLKPEVLVAEKDRGFALALLVPLPETDDEQARLETVIRRAEASFPGKILQRRGDGWLQIDFLTEDEAKAIGWSAEAGGKKLNQKATPPRSP